jgi:lysophospholipase L1-like esterase
VGGWGRRIGAVAFGVAVGLLAAEALVRIAAPQQPSPLVWRGEEGLVRLDPRSGFALIPGFSGPFFRGTRVDVSSLGLRDREYGPKQPGEIRVLSLGDSFAFGYGVENADAYCKVLERRLRSRFPGVPIAVVNAGVGATSTRHMILQYERLRDVLHPDLALATFTAGNDVVGNWDFDGQLRQHVLTPLGPLGRHSHLVRLVRKALFPITFYFENRAPWEVAYTIEQLAILEHTLAADRVPYLMLVVPTRHQVRPFTYPVAKVMWSLGWERIDARQSRMVIAHFESAGVSYIDLLPVLAARDSTESAFIEDDEHTNAAGHRAIADAIFARIEPMVARLIEARAD